MAFRKQLDTSFKLITFSRRLKSTLNQSEKRPPVCLAYRTYQETSSTSTPIIITHGMMGNKDNWHSLSKVLSKTGRQIVTVDARNHGESPHVPTMDYYSMSQDIIDLMDELEIEKACLLGHSMGGKMSMVVALQQPDRVESLIVVDVAPKVSPRAKTYPAFLQQMLKTQVQLYQQQDLPISTARQIAEKQLEAVEPDPMIRKFLASNLIQVKNRYRWRVNLDSIINNYGELCGFPELQDMHYTGPTLFIGGSESNYLTESEEPEIKRLFPKSHIEHIPGAGHWVHSEKPSAFLDIVKTFLNECQNSSIIKC